MAGRSSIRYSALPYCYIHVLWLVASQAQVHQLQQCSTIDQLVQRCADVTTACCDEPTERCVHGIPSSCNAGCAAVLLPTLSDCGDLLGRQEAADSGLGQVRHQLQDAAQLCADDAGAAACSPETFKSSLENTQCSGFVAQRNVKSHDECRRQCCEDTGCSGFTWCPDSFPGCPGWAGVRCHLGLVDADECTAASHWVGESKISAPPPPPAATRRQGFSGFVGDYFSCNDMKALGLGDSWFYTWTPKPFMGAWNSCPDGPLSQGYEFVPMIIGVHPNVAGGIIDPSPQMIQSWHDYNAHYLLGYNEPDPGKNHPNSVDPVAAASAWVKVQQIAEREGLTLVSPALATTGLDDDGASEWMDAFLAECARLGVETPGSCDPEKIVYIAFHDYTGSVDIVRRRIDGLHARYKRQVWITEIAINRWGCRVNLPNVPSCDPALTREEEDAYMRDLLPMLDTHPAVFRYAWFTSRNQLGAGQQGLLGGASLLLWNESAPTLTSTGAIYAAHAAANNHGQGN